MNQAYALKFLPITITIKKNGRQLQLNAGYSMNKIANI